MPGVCSTPGPGQQDVEGASALENVTLPPAKKHCETCGSEMPDLRWHRRPLLDPGDAKTRHLGSKGEKRLRPVVPFPRNQVGPITRNPALRAFCPAIAAVSAKVRYSWPNQLMREKYPGPMTQRIMA